MKDVRIDAIITPGMPLSFTKETDVDSAAIEKLSEEYRTNGLVKGSRKKFESIFKPMDEIAG